MLKRCILGEWMKLRHSRIWMILLPLPVMSVLIGCANFYMNRAALQSEWYSLWSQVSLFYGEFFFPILIAICCAYMCRLEHFNKNWNMVMTAPVPTGCIFLAKLAVVGILLVLTQGFFFLLYFCGGKLMGLSSALPMELPGWLFRGWVAALAISAFQLALSVRVRSFATPIGIGLCASFLGLGMYVLHLGMLFPHALLTIGMGVLSQTGLASAGNHLLFFTMCLMYIAIISLAAIHRMRKSDVNA
ncbi:ABC transporter permease [uncultured Paenibacillus sp.]|uniref:ABC transporter permease n=1 Tax=uncultured Paenibacillus sp. TaxID=227322 RepID=UPI0015AF2401|nr:ABC transporter permease [uncultured Paenibacillus sp.]